MTNNIHIFRLEGYGEYFGALVSHRSWNFYTGRHFVYVETLYEF